MILAFQGITPRVHETAYVAPSAVLIGNVDVGPEASIWFNAVLRGDGEPIVIGPGSNIQDGTVVHTDPGYPCQVGERVTVGHNVTLHGCVVEDYATVGMGATVLTGAHLETESLVAAGALVPERARVPAGMLVAGVPAKPRRTLSEAQRERFRSGTDGYIERRGIYLRMDSSAAP